MTWGGTRGWALSTGVGDISLYAVYAGLYKHTHTPPPLRGPLPFPSALRAVFPLDPTPVPCAACV